jgi:hypothetical protein
VRNEFDGAKEHEGRRRLLICLNVGTSMSCE